MILHPLRPTHIPYIHIPSIQIKHRYTQLALAFLNYPLAVLIALGLLPPLFLLPYPYPSRGTGQGRRWREVR